MHIVVYSFVVLLIKEMRNHLLNVNFRLTAKSISRNVQLFLKIIFNSHNFWSRTEWLNFFFNLIHRYILTPYLESPCSPLMNLPGCLSVIVQNDRVYTERGSCDVVSNTVGVFSGRGGTFVEKRDYVCMFSNKSWEDCLKPVLTFKEIANLHSQVKLLLKSTWIQFDLSSCTPQHSGVFWMTAYKCTMNIILLIWDDICTRCWLNSDFLSTKTEVKLK